MKHYVTTAGSAYAPPTHHPSSADNPHKQHCSLNQANPYFQTWQLYQHGHNHVTSDVSNVNNPDVIDQGMRESFERPHIEHIYESPKFMRKSGTMEAL